MVLSFGLLVSVQHPVARRRAHRAGSLSVPYIAARAA